MKPTQPRHPWWFPLRALVLVATLVSVIACAAPPQATAPAAPPAAAPTTAPQAAAPTAAPKAPAATEAPKVAAPTTAPQPAAPTAAPKAKASGPVTLVASYPTQPSTLDVHTSNDTGTRRYLYHIFESLIEARDDKTDFIPILATSWEKSADGLKYTFKLRKDVKFHDGSPFNAEAVVFNIKSQIDEKHPGRHAGTYGQARLYLWAVKDVVAIDDLTVEFTLTEPAAPFLFWLTTGAGFMVSPTAIKKYGDDVANNPVGTGPYKFVEYRRGERLTLAANETYWGGKPAIDTMVIAPVTDTEARLATLESGRAQFILELPPDAAANLATKKDYKLIRVQTGQIWSLHPNAKMVPAFKDKRVRQAMNYAINKEAIVKDVLKGSGIVAASPWSPVFGDWYDASIKPYPYDPTKAKALLKEAGFETGLEINLHVPTGGSSMQNPVDMSQAIKTNFEAVGIKVNLKTYEYPAFYDLFRAGKLEIGPGAWYSNQNDPDNFLTTFFHSSRQPAPEGQGGLNITYYSNPELDKLISDARVTADFQKRRDLVHKAMRIIYDDAVWVFVDHMIDQHAGVANLEGVVLRGNGMIDFRQAKLAQ